VLLWAFPEPNTACISAYHFTSSQVHRVVITDHRKLKNTALECSPVAKFSENKPSLHFLFEGKKAEDSNS
jgi:hypothetical protein